MIRFLAAVILVLSIALGIGGWMLKKSWQDNATLQDNITQYEETVDGLQKDLTKAEQESQLTEVTVVDNAKEKEIIYQTREEIKYVVKEIAKELPPTDCINQSMPAPIIDCLRSGDCRREEDTNTGLPAESPDTGDSRAEPAG